MVFRDTGLTAKSHFLVFHSLILTFYADDCHVLFVFICSLSMFEVGCFVVESSQGNFPQHCHLSGRLTGSNAK